MKHRGLRTWIEIDRRAIAHNYRLIRSLIPKRTKLLGVVKSNAYGHYLHDFAKELERLGADFLGIDSFVEAAALRKEGIRSPILVLGHTLPENFAEAARKKISLAVSSFEQLRYLERAKGLLRIHLKADTGMHRQGFALSDMSRVKKFLGKNLHSKRFALEGIFTHFAGAKGKDNGTYTRLQMREFKEWVAMARGLGYCPIVHAAASGGTLLFPESHFDMVRPGIALYGIWPSEEAEKKLSRRLRLRPVLSWRTVISEIKTLPKGERIGYDLTEKLKRPSVVAVCPIGYWHGFPRALSSIGYVLVRGKRAKVLGRVSMDMISVDITGIKGAEGGDVVTLIGRDGKETLRAEDIARSIPGSSSYELVTRLNPLIKRYFI